MVNNNELQQYINNILEKSKKFTECENEETLLKEINTLKNNKTYLKTLENDLIDEYTKSSSSGSVKLLQIIITKYLQKDITITKDLISDLKDKYKNNEEYFKDFFQEEKYKIVLNKYLKDDKNKDMFRNWGDNLPNMFSRLLYLKQDFNEINNQLESIATDTMKYFMLDSEYTFEKQGLLGNQGYVRTDPVIMIYKSSVKKESSIQLSLYFNGKDDNISIKIQYGKDNNYEVLKEVPEINNFEDLKFAIQKNIEYFKEVTDAKKDKKENNTILFNEEENILNKYGTILKEMYNDGKANKTSMTNVIAFGFKYANIIKDLKIKLEDLTKFAKIDSSLGTEIRKGMNLYFYFYSKIDEVSKNDNNLNLWTNLSRNKIYFGAPGTGKSYQLKEDMKTFIEVGSPNEHFHRVTFHPDYTYSDFVGTYKPKMDGEKIKYSFVPGPFLKTYAEAITDKDNKPHMLIIEEINRANVAAVFGDVFQLLDRNSDNESEYKIDTSEDIKDWLKEQGAKEPEKLKIPKNMFIWATMNSADQGVFPMDTAFKRRWDFEYIGIDDKEVKLLKDDSGNDLSKDNISVIWNEIRKAINEKLLANNINEDKCLGPFFISKNILDKNDKDKFLEIFKSKVIMYLYEDVLKHRKDVLFDGYNTYSKVCDDIKKWLEKNVDKDIADKLYNDENNVIEQDNVEENVEEE